MTQSNILTPNQPSPDLAGGTITLLDRQIPITNAGPNEVLRFEAVAGEVLDLRVYLYSDAAADPTYKVHRNVIVVGTAIGGGAVPLDASEPTFGALNWNVNVPSIAAGPIAVTLQTLGADTPRQTRVRIELVRPRFVPTI